MTKDKTAVRRDQGKRLRAARENAGFETAIEGASAVGVPSDTYTQHENGRRGFKGRVEEYARVFKVSPEWLLWGQPSQQRMAQISALLGEVPKDQRALAEDLVISTLQRMIKQS